MEIVGAEPPSVEQIADRHARLLSRLREVAAANGHDPDRLRIVGITKGQPVEVVRGAVRAGLTILGENRVQEAEPKITAEPNVEWHLVCHLQSNQARRAVQGFDAIHSIDDIELMQRVAGIARQEHRSPTLMLQVNVSGEASKSGMTPDAALAAAPVLGEAGVRGLMTIAPMGASVTEARAIFGALRELRERLEQVAGMGMPELSMGMTADAEAAAAEGATLVRIGTGLFGPRAA